MLYVWISCFCIGLIGALSSTRLVSGFTRRRLTSVRGRSVHAHRGRPLRWHHWQVWFVSDTGHFILQGVDDVTVSQIQKRLLQRTGEEIVDVIVPQTLEEIVGDIIVCTHVRADHGRTSATSHGGK